MRIGIASGKGGTGKTTVAVGLARCAPEPVQLLDCDVEEPNVHLFFSPPRWSRTAVTLPVPVLDAGRCDGCGVCSRICQFHAIALLGDRPALFPELCHGCGGCVWACPRDALSEVAEAIGEVEEAEAADCRLVQGRLRVGKAWTPPVIRAVKQRADASRLVLVDGPPGTACAMAAALAGCDAVLLVAEPTRFGLHDLGLVVDAVRLLGMPFGVVLNRVRGDGDGDGVRAYCREQRIPVLQELPESPALGAAYARGVTAVDAVPELRPAFGAIWPAVRRLAGAP